MRLALQHQYDLNWGPDRWVEQKNDSESLPSLIGRLARRDATRRH